MQANGSLDRMRRVHSRAALELVRSGRTYEPHLSHISSWTSSGREQQFWSCAIYNSGEKGNLFFMFVTVPRGQQCEIMSRQAGKTIAMALVFVRDRSAAAAAPQLGFDLLGASPLSVQCWWHNGNKLLHGALDL